MKLSVPTVAFSQVALTQLTPHPRNWSIYGEEDVSELLELIRASQWVKPLVVTQNYTIISGHRRWKAVCLLGWETVPVEYRDFPDETAELEALLLENASRFKTIEQKIREAQAWKDVETFKARRRQIELAGTRLRTQKNSDHKPNLAYGHEKGQTRDKVAARVGLKRTTYEKAAKVVRAIDAEMSQGNLEDATALRKILNEQSVDAAVQLLKQPCEERHQILSLIGASQAKNTKEAMALIQQSQDSTQKPLSQADPSHSSQQLRSCWDCQHRTELISNHSFYCNRLGVMSLIDKTADLRGAECDLWSYYSDNSSETENRAQTSSTFTLILPAHLQQPIQDAARAVGVSVIDWTTWVMEEALTTYRTNKSASQQTDKTLHHVTECHDS